MSHTAYKTRSNTLLLRRLISNLKERGSDVAGELEERAQDLLSDVQTRKKKTKEVKFESDEDSSSSDWEDAPEIPNIKLYIPPQRCVSILERKTPNPPSTPPTAPIFTLPTPPSGIATPPIGTITPPTPLFFTPPTSPITEPQAPNLPIISIKDESEMTPAISPEPVRHIVRPPKLTLSISKDSFCVSKKDTPSLSAEKTQLTPDCKLYWIQKHLEQEKEEKDKIRDLSADIDQIHFGVVDDKSAIEETFAEDRIVNKDDSNVQERGQEDLIEVNIEPTVASDNQKIISCRPKIVLKHKKIREKKEEANENEYANEPTKKLKVAGQRSKKPTLARVWRKQKEKQKLEIKNEIVPCL